MHLMEQGLSIKMIAEQTGLGQRTINRYKAAMVKKGECDAV